MNYRRLGNTGLEVSEIGFGAWGVGGAASGTPAYGPTDDAESRAALRRAYDMGVNFFDTSDLYGHGHSEKLIGETFSDVRQDVIIATKVGFLDAVRPQDFSPQHMKDSLEASLKRLHTDYVDLYQLHSPSMALLRDCDDVVSTMHVLNEAGKARAIGISVASPDDGIAAVTEFGFAAIQVNLNLVDQRAIENGLLQLCQQADAGIIVRTPLCFGFLTGEYSPASNFEPGDHRSKWPAAQIKLWAEAYRLFATAVIQNHPQTHAQLALRFCLSHPGVSTVIPGMLTTEHVDDNVRASGLGPLDLQEIEEIANIFRSSCFFLAG